MASTKDKKCSKADCGKWAATGSDLCSTHSLEAAGGTKCRSEGCTKLVAAGATLCLQHISAGVAMDPTSLTPGQSKMTQHMMSNKDKHEEGSGRI